MEEAILWCRRDQARALTPLDPRVEKAVRFLADNLARPLHVADVVRACNASRARRMALFRRPIGLPLKRCLEQERMRRARQLLASGLLAVHQ